MTEQNKNNDPYTLTPEEAEAFRKKLAEQDALLDTKTPEELIAIGLDRSVSALLRRAALVRPKLTPEVVAKVWEYIARNPIETQYLRFQSFVDGRMPLPKAQEIAQNIILDRTENSRLRLDLLSAMPADHRQTLAQAILDNEYEDPGMRHQVRVSVLNKAKE